MQPSPVPWALVLLPLLASCTKDPPPTPSPSTSGQASAASPAASPAPSAAPSAAPAAKRGLAVSSGKATFLIDAPLEKIKGNTPDARGSINLDPADLSKTTGEISFKLTSLKTTTFGDQGKDGSQTEHALNWMEVGPDSKASDRAKFEWATFKVTSIEASPGKLSEAKEEGGARTVKGKVSGDFTLHGVTSKKTIPFTATIKGPPDAPTSVSLKTDAPLDVSLKEHDVKPRDKVGAFLAGSLEKIGKKIDDRVQVSLEIAAGN